MIKIKNIDISYSIDFNGFEIIMRNGHGREPIIYNAKQLMEIRCADKKEFQRVGGLAEDYILNDFKKTDIHANIVLQINTNCKLK